MRLFVNAHARGPTLFIEAELSDTIAQIKRKLEPECDIVPEKQVLSFKGKKMDDDSASLGSYGVQQDYSLIKQTIWVANSSNR